MYFLESARGLGLGAQMIDLCLVKAKDFKFEGCYLETMTTMKAAQKLYLKNGFEYINDPLGNTGHYSCPIYMLKNIQL
jgi:putative acetyltransferase